MKRNEIIAVVLAILATVGTIAAALIYEHTRTEAADFIVIEARSPLNGNWNPVTITVREGDVVRLKIRNVETVAHGFSLPDFGAGITELKPGEVKTVEFTANKSGTFKFFCTVWCSQEHMAMVGEVVVEPELAQAQ